MNFAEEKILKEKWSPDSVCGYAKLHHLFDEFICTNTLYRYIDRPDIYTYKGNQIFREQAWKIIDGK